MNESLMGGKSRDLAEGRNRDLLVSEKNKVYANQNLDSISLGDKISIGDNFLSVLSPEKIEQFNLRASAKYGTSFKCLDNNVLAFGRNSENSDLGMNVICSSKNSKISSNSCLDNLDLFKNSSLCFSNSLNKNSGATKLNLLNRLLRAKTLNESPLVNNEERTTLTSMTNSIFNHSIYLFDSDSFILSDNSSTSCSVNSDLEIILLSRAILSNLDLINLSIKIDQSMFGVCLINVNSSGISILISINKNNADKYINVSDFNLIPIKQVYENIHGGEIYFSDLENKLLKIKLIIKENYDGQIYDDNLEAGDTYGDWADYRKIEIQAEVTISLPVDNINFGFIGMGATNDTTDNSSAPFEIQNDGNCLLNISLNATDLWASIFGNSSYYQLKVDNKTGEEGAFNWDLSDIDWAQVLNNTQIVMVELNWSDATDSAEMDLLVTVPPQESAGDKSSTLHFTADLGE